MWNIFIKTMHLSCLFFSVQEAASQANILCFIFHVELMIALVSTTCIATSLWKTPVDSSLIWIEAFPPIAAET